MELTFEQQSTAFLWSIALGAGFGILYGIIKFFRAAFKLRRLSTFFCDIFFMLFCAFAVFLFSLGFINGYVRIYVIIGALAGFFAYRLTVGKLLYRLYSPILRFVHKIVSKISDNLKIFAKKLLKIPYKILYNKNDKKDKILNDINNKRKKNGKIKRKAQNKKISVSRFAPGRRQDGRAKGSQAGQKT